MSESHSTAPVRPDKPAKPHDEFPLFAHAAGVWAKKIRGKLHYFGPWADHDGALAKYLGHKDDLHAGRTAGVKTAEQSAGGTTRTARRGCTGSLVKRTRAPLPPTRACAHRAADSDLHIVYRGLLAAPELRLLVTIVTAYVLAAWSLQTSSAVPTAPCPLAAGRASSADSASASTTLCTRPYRG